MGPFLRKNGLPVATLVGLFVLWEVAVRIFNVPSFIIPAPSAALAKIFAFPGAMFRHTGTTLYETVLGFLLGIAIGVVAAIVIVYSVTLQKVIYPLIVLSQVLPKIAIAPILMIWAGYGPLSKVLIALLICFFPMVVSTVTGLRSVDPDLVDLARSLCASEIKIFRKIRFPNALPYLFVGLKLSITLAVIGAIVGEFIGGSQGLGYLILSANFQMDTAMMFAGLFLLSVLGLVLFGLIMLLERIFIPWSITEQDGGEPMATI
jgi:NitT/TauT family transport system permease protein